MTPATILSRNGAPSERAIGRNGHDRSGRSENLAGIVLAGSYGSAESAFAELMPRPLVPIAQVPLITYVLRWLRTNGVARATLCANERSRAVRTFLRTPWSRDLALDYLEDSSPRGPAGCARDAALATSADTFVVVEGTVVPTLDLDALLEAHSRSKASLTIVVNEDALRQMGEVRGATPAGVYVFSRRALDVVSSTGFQDIKEHLIPALRTRSERVVAYVAPEVSPRVLNAATYLAVNHWVIEQLPRMPTLGDGWDGFSAVGEVVKHAAANVHPSATLVGPVILGPGVSIGQGVTIVGPTSIGARTRVGARAFISRSVVWSDCTVGERALVDSTVVADAVTIPVGALVEREVRMTAARGPLLGRQPANAPGDLRRVPARPVADLAIP